MVKILLAVKGDLRATLRNRETAYLRGLKAGLENSASSTKTRLRKDVIGAGLSRRLSNTIQDDVFPRRGVAYEPSAIVYSKAPKILSLLADGGTVKAKNGGARLIPIKGSPADDLRKDRGAQNRGQTLLAQFEQKFGAGILFKVERPGKAAILMARLHKSKAGKYSGLGRFRSEARLGKKVSGHVDVPVFTLARQTQHARKLDARAIMARGAKDHPVTVARAVTAAMKNSNRETIIR